MLPIRSPQNLQELKKKSAPIRQGHQEAEPFKRRRSRVNGRTSKRIETCERDENGRMSLVMPLLWLTGGFNGCVYMVLCIRVQEKQRRGYCHLSIASFLSES
ncbi:hypothetical protein [Microcoleus sp. Pol17C2]|uniref:hypothetical protein n=1 Tax=Microcoleus sp. Pol17C2 TaxID=3055403 RepID=UPI002FD42713